MSISPINFNGMIQNTGEVSQTKANDDQKSVMQQSNLSVEVEKKQEQQQKQVNNLEETQKKEDSYDREGNGKGYEGNKQRKKAPKIVKDQKLQGDGKVSPKPMTSFDMRV